MQSFIPSCSQHWTQYHQLKVITISHLPESVEGSECTCMGLIIFFLSESLVELLVYVSEQCATVSDTSLVPMLLGAYSASPIRAGDLVSLVRNGRRETYVCTHSTAIMRVVPCCDVGLTLLSHSPSSSDCGLLYLLFLYEVNGANVQVCKKNTYQIHVVPC